MELKEMMEVMEHFGNGGEVEYTETGFNKWRIANDPSWNWYDFKYRIKPEKQKIIIEKWLCSDKRGDFVVIETTNIEEYTYITKKIKLIETYEVEL